MLYNGGCVAIFVCLHDDNITLWSRPANVCKLCSASQTGWSSYPVHLCILAGFYLWLCMCIWNEISCIMVVIWFTLEVMSMHKKMQYSGDISTQSKYLVLWYCFISIIMISIRVPIPFHVLLQLYWTSRHPIHCFFEHFKQSS